jgi:hypothetical protein
MDIDRYLSFSETPIFMKQVDKTGSLEVLFEIHALIRKGRAGRSNRRAEEAAWCRDQEN